jgi:hypothetical protein
MRLLAVILPGAKEQVDIVESFRLLLMGVTGKFCCKVAGKSLACGNSVEDQGTYKSL